MGMSGLVVADATLGSAIMGPILPPAPVATLLSAAAAATPGRGDPPPSAKYPLRRRTGGPQGRHRRSSVSSDATPLIASRKPR